MTEHTKIRLEKSGVVVAYFAPAALVLPQGKNQLKHDARPKDKSSIVRDMGLIVTEVIVQGKFVHSSDLPSAHKTDLTTLFGADPVTPIMQVRRIWHYFAKVGGSFQFHNDGDQYTATTEAAVNLTNGIFPHVAIDEFRPEHVAGRETIDYNLKLAVGLER